MAGIAAGVQHGRVGVVDTERGSEKVGVMATAAVGGGYQVRGHRGRLGRRLNAIGIIVAGNTGQYRGINQTVIELPPFTIGNVETESRDAMAVTTIDITTIGSGHHRMSHRWISNVVGGRYSMTGIATGSDDGGICVVGEGAQKTRRRMTANALSTGNRMGAGRVIGSRGRFAGCCAAVVATGTATRNTRVIKLAVRAKFKKTGGIVAVVALGAGRLMKLGFPNCHNTVMAFAAVAKHFLMVDKRS